MLIARKDARFSTYLYLSESSPVIQTQNKPQFNALCFKYSNNPNSIGPNTRSLAVLNYISSVSWDSAVKSVVLHFSNEQSDSNIQFVCKTLSTKQILSKSLLLKWKQTKTHLLSECEWQQTNMTKQDEPDCWFYTTDSIGKDKAVCNSIKGSGQLPVAGLMMLTNSLKVWK